MKIVWCFLMGIFLINGVPHFINGIQGKKFHSPFATPPVKGYSSPLVNVIWGIANFICAYLIYLLSDINFLFLNQKISFFIGLLFMSILLAIIFDRVDNNYK